MARDSSRHSSVSIISVDPLVASQITNTSVTSDTHRTSQPSSHRSKSVRSSSSNTKSKNGDSQQKRGQTSQAGGRTNSLRRVKDSTEVLRQRTGRTQVADKRVEKPSNPREGRQYTVGNVAGGLLYLRPAAGRPSPAVQNPLMNYPLTPPKSAQLLQEHDKSTPWGGEETYPGTQRPLTPASTTLKRSATSARKSLEQFSRPHHNRSYSMSSVDDHQLVPEISSGALRIVINRSSPSRKRAAQSFALPSLEVPIPHYRLGTPRFSTQGTPVLRSSAYTRSSGAVSDTNRTSRATQAEFSFPAPPGTRDTATFAIGKFATQPAYLGMAVRANNEKTERAILTASTSSMDSARSIAPSIFDDLNKKQNDPSIVRYAPKTQSIMAATPARIVAQISSESFMDYDLVSDFFLTFRSYMSTMQLLNLLLARLKWAIGRMEDDGRIIRIRTFAALRHWILNYFTDDFVPDRGLRLRFCELINNMYDEVRSRTKSVQSDLKILHDLKRCWNGRCSLYWDSPYFAIDTNLDADIIPGGVLGSRKSDLSEPFVWIPEEAGLASGTARTAHMESTQGGRGKSSKPMVPASQSRHRVIISTVLPGSPGSELGAQPISCSIPVSMPRWPGLSKPSPEILDTQSVQTRRHKAPANLAVQTQHAHRRSTKSVDSSREPTPVTGDPPVTPYLYTGSVIRGQVYPPASAIVQVLSSVSVDTHSRFDLHGLAQGQQNAANPVNRSIFGSIRRALGAKHGSDDITMLAMPNAQNQATLRGRIWTKPLSTSKSHDELRKLVDSRPVKSQMRVDLLCAAVAQTYEAVRAAAEANDQAVRAPETAPPEPKFQSLLRPETYLDTRPRRLGSHGTQQSGSILIVDDTGLDIPPMSGALPTELYEYEMTPRAADGMPDVISSKQPQSHNTAYHAILGGGGKGNVSDHFTAGRPPSVDTVVGLSQVKGSPVDGKSAVISSPALDEDEDEVETSTLPAQTLRRRPGGDLKKTQHVHDLELTSHHESFNTVGAGTDSAGGSLVIMSNRGSNSPRFADTAAQKPISMINTHSSQHLRPSFEAAVAGFSAIPDDVDGGLEATLLKLEGRYDKESPLLGQTPPGEGRVVSPRREQFGDDSPSTEKRMHRHEHVQEDTHDLLDDPTHLLQMNEISSPAPSHTYRASPGVGLGLLRHSAAGSEDSRNLVPLLERNYFAESATDNRTHLTATRLTVSDTRPSPKTSQSQTSHPSIEFVEKTASMEQIGQGPTVSHFDLPSSAKSFLLDEDENLSDLSSEISVDIINQSDIIPRPFSPMIAAPGTARSGLDLPSHPLGHSSGIYQQPKSTEASIKVNVNLPQRMPLTPDPSPLQEHDRAEWSTQHHTSVPLQHSDLSVPLRPSSAHIPFILACDSQVLAQQLTLIEKEALSEIEWTDLVEMRWDHKSANICDWAEYLATTEHTGVDLVVTRFNLVVKWVLSEIVLTQNIHERARAIIKFIHTAAHARRLHNYSTMLQITIALTSTDCTRLTKTWELISTPDRSLLKNMEALVQPVRNFHELRAEMESTDLSEGCVPFIGLYVHDLTYNAQKPSQVAGTRESEPLVNFERYRTAATIVKGLLRLIDASSKYTFEPVEGIVDRCLWMAALDDEKIRELSKSLEA